MTVFLFSHWQLQERITELTHALNTTRRELEAVKAEKKQLEKQLNDMKAQLADSADQQKKV